MLWMRSTVLSPRRTEAVPFPFSRHPASSAIVSDRVCLVPSPSRKPSLTRTRSVTRREPPLAATPVHGQLCSTSSVGVSVTLQPSGVRQAFQPDTWDAVRLKRLMHALRHSAEVLRVSFNQNIAKAPALEGERHVIP